MQLNEKVEHTYNNDLTNHLRNCDSPKNIVLMQLESIDWRTLNTAVGKGPMVPTLAQLAKQGSLMKMETIHIIGSLDVDFGSVRNSVSILYYIQNRIESCQRNSTLKKL